MSYIYLFETKSIQSYLGRTGNLRDLIAISDKLDNFIDDSNDCILGKVLQTLHETYPDDPINFIRRRGGSFYSYSKNESALSDFRKLWLLVFYQYFPYMQHTDYFGEISDDSSKFKEEIRKAFKKLNGIFFLNLVPSALNGPFIPLLPLTLFPGSRMLFANQ